MTALRPWASVTAKSIRWNIVGQVACQIANAASLPLLARRFGPDRLGIALLLTTSLALLTAIDGGLTPAVQRFATSSRARSDAGAVTRLAVTAALAVAALSILAFATVALVGDRLVRALDVPPALFGDVRTVVSAVAPLFFLTLLGNIAGGVLQGHERYRAHGLASLAGAVAFLVTIVLGTGRSNGIAWFVAATCLQRLVVLSWLAAAALHHLGRGHGLLLRSEERREVFVFAAKMQASGLTALVNNQADALVIAALLPIRYVGYYAAGASVAAVVRSVPLWALPPLATSMYVSHANGGELALTRRFSVLQPIWLEFTTLVTVVAAAAAAALLPLVLGPGYGIASLVLLGLALANGVNVTTAMLSSLVRAAGLPGLELQYGAIAVVVNVALTAALALPFGLAGVLVGTVAGVVVGSVAFGSLVRRSGLLTGRVFTVAGPWQGARWAVPAALVAAAVAVGRDVLPAPLSVAAVAGAAAVAVGGCLHRSTLPKLAMALDLKASLV